MENEIDKNAPLDTQNLGTSVDYLNNEAESNVDVSHNEEFKQYLTFYINNELYGIELEYVKEVIDYCNVTRIPGIPDYIRGVINLRGNVIPIIDLSPIFFRHLSQKTKFTAIAILEISSEDQDMTVGAIIDSFNSVNNILLRDIEHTPEFGAKIRSDFIHGIAHDKNKLITLLDIKRVIDIEELTSFNENGK